MTLDVAIGKIIVEDYEGQCYLDIKHCPDLGYDLCELQYTAWPRESYRSGSTGFREFFRYNDKLFNIYHKMRGQLETDDRDVARIEPFLKDINLMSEDTFTEPMHKDRWKWFHFWCNRAIALYGKEAGISFS